MSRRPKGNNASVALFPFLAVLMSTMGALILLLVLISRQARTQVENEREAAAARAAQAADDDEAVAQRRDDLEWTNRQLVASRDKTAAELAGLRATLAHIEEHSDRLRRQIAEAQAALKLLESQSSLDESARKAKLADLEELRRKIAQKEAELREAEKAGLRPQAYAIVPFDGSGATRRRPIYIECRSDRIVLQPEGIVFREDDFADGQGPANPLAACVRAAAEYAERLNPTRVGEQPYPLLLVRPDGISAYYAARSAMSTWDEEFGYELIDAEWPLEFPEPDPRLAELLARTADDARLRQAILAKAAPSIRHAPPTATYGVSRSGHGIERIDGGTGGPLIVGSGRGGNWKDPPSRGGRDSHASRGSGVFGSGDRSPAGNALVGGSPGGSGSGGTGLNGTGLNGAGLNGAAPAGAPGAMGGGPAGGSSSGGPGLGNPGGYAGTTSGVGGPSATGSRTGTSGGTGTGNGNNGGGDGTSRYAGAQPGDGGGGRNASNNNSGNGSAGSSQYAGNGPSSGGGAAGDGSPFGGSGGSAGSSTGGGSAAGESALQQASNSPNASMVSRSESMPDRLADKRGADWGLPQKGPNATGLTRPISVYCSNDRIVVLTERGEDKPILVEGRIEAAVDDLVNGVWEQVRSWGAPGRNMYWKPQLTMHVAPDGERRFEELKALLDGSGLDVVGKPMVIAAPQTIYRQPRR